ncbi:hypothetical protein, partial [Vibrio sp.]|uniref:hypothetical protein n=1 Tax=Vibrio sp. TaxID=678 RepID=UPI003D0FBCBF
VYEAESECWVVIAIGAGLGLFDKAAEGVPMATAVPLATLNSSFLIEPESPPQPEINAAIKIGKANLFRMISTTNNNIIN